MNIEDVTNINELTEFMNAEAALYGRTESDQRSGNGQGIQKQWNEEDKTFPYEIFYLRYTSCTPRLDGSSACSFNIEALWFDEDGNVTERPQRNTDTLYHND